MACYKPGHTAGDELQRASEASSVAHSKGFEISKSLLFFCLLKNPSLSEACDGGLRFEFVVLLHSISLNHVPSAGCPSSPYYQLSPLCPISGGKINIMHLNHPEILPPLPSTLLVRGKLPSVKLGPGVGLEHCPKYLIISFIVEYPISIPLSSCSVKCCPEEKQAFKCYYSNIASVYYGPNAIKLSRRHVIGD